MRARWTHLLPYLLFLVHAAPLGGWINDDAGITFSYARNLAYGHGLVSQPGVEPVEGYSNFLWLMLLVPFFKMHLFHPLWVPKILGITFALAAMFVTRKALVTAVGPAGATCAIALVALQPPFVIWSVSGLENPLYAFSTATLLLICFRYLAGNLNPARLAVVASLLALAIALVRPDGVLYATAFPLVAVYAMVIDRRGKLSAVRADLLTYFCVFVLGYGGFLAFRFAYFEDLLPNTYYAKGGVKTVSFVNLALLRSPTFERLRELIASTTGESLGGLALMAVPIGLIWLSARRRLVTPPDLLLVLFVSIGVCVYILLPADYMREYRFATPVFLFFPALIVVGLVRVGEALQHPLHRRLIMGGGLVLIFTLSTRQAIIRTPAFAAVPPVPFEWVAQNFGHAPNRYAELLELPRASLLVPDLGGALYYSRLRVFDLAGLCDKVIARTLGKDQRRFYDYVFEDVKPTFIGIHTHWSWLARLEEDPRFSRDYVAISEKPDVQYGERVLSGFHVRREAIAGRRATVKQIRGELQNCCANLFGGPDSALGLEQLQGPQP